MKPPEVVAAGPDVEVVVDEAKPFVVDVVEEYPPELDVEVNVAVLIALIVPVHAAPTGQQATLPAMSAEQTALG